MKKRKINLLLNIATLCLCVAAIAFGVYSAKTASLNVSGTIGFNAHNVDYDVTGTIVGHSGTDGLPVTTAEALTKDASGNLVLGDRTFSDLGTSGEVETITIELTITNKSAFAIAVKVNLPESTTADSNIIIDSPKDYSAVILADKNATDTTKTGKIQFTLNIKAGTQEIATTNAVSLKVDLAKTDIAVGTAVRADLPVEIKKFTSEYGESVRDNILKMTPMYEPAEYFMGMQDQIRSYAERYPYYVEMGQVTGVSDKVNWLIVGTNESDTISTLTDTDKQALSEGLMLNKSYVMLSEKVLYAEKNTSNYGISFQNNYTDDSTTTPAYKNASGYSAQDYATSNVRAYLKGETVQRSSKSSSGSYIPDGTNVNLLTTYNLSSDPLYAKIQGRTLTSLYTNIGTAKGSIWSSSYAGIEENLKSTAQDKLWLLSENEIKNVFGFADDTTDTDCVFSAITYLYGSTSDLGYWSLRSPYSTQTGEYIYYMHMFGQPCPTQAKDTIYGGTRPAFLF